MLNEPLELVLTDLSQGLPAMTPSLGAALAEACAVCLEDRGYSQGVEITVSGDFVELSTPLSFVAKK